MGRDLKGPTSKGGEKGGEEESEERRGEGGMGGERGERGKGPSSQKKILAPPLPPISHIPLIPTIWHCYAFPAGSGMEWSPVHLNVFLRSTLFQKNYTLFIFAITLLAI